MLKKSTKKISVMLVVLCMVVLGSLVGSGTTFAHVWPYYPVNLAAGWNNLPSSGGIMHEFPGVYVFYQQAYLYSSSDDIYVDWVRSYGGDSIDPSGEFGPTYLWADDDGDYVWVYGFAGFLIEGIDTTTHQHMWFNDISEALVLQQATWTWYPNGFTIAYDSWWVTP
jgi:hypothetical protein